jgi:hypothetical protein
MSKVDSHGGKRPGAGRPKGATTVRGGIGHARLRKERALARLREAEADQVERRLMPVTDMTEALRTVAAVVHAGLRTLPGRLASEAVAGQQAQVQDAALRITSEILDDLQRAIRRCAKAHAVAAGLTELETEGGVVRVADMPD